MSYWLYYKLIFNCPMNYTMKSTINCPIKNPLSPDCGVANPSPPPHTRFFSRIVGGSDTAPAQFPWMVKGLYCAALDYNAL